MITASIEKIDSDAALELLKGNDSNRNLRTYEVERWVRIIRAGNWKVNGETVKVADTGRLLDGQHRLHGIAKAGVPVEVIVVRGLADDVMPTIDTGIRRTTSDMLAWKGYVSTHLLGSTAMLARRFDIGDFPRVADRKPTNPELLEFVDRNPDALMRGIHAASALRTSFRTNPTVAATAYFIFSRVDTESADEFFSLMTSGHGLLEGNPILLLRNRLIKESTAPRAMPTDNIFAIYIKAWNAWREGRQPRLLVWRPEEPFPVPA